MENYFRKKKNYCGGFMPGDFQVICDSMVAENHQSSASTENPGHYIFDLCYLLDSQL